MKVYISGPMEGVKDYLENFRVVEEAGLGDERYKGKVIPSAGSAPVTAAVYNGGTGKKG